MFFCVFCAFCRVPLPPFAVLCVLCCVLCHLGVVVCVIFISFAVVPGFSRHCVVFWLCFVVVFALACLLVLFWCFVCLWCGCVSVGVLGVGVVWCFGVCVVFYVFVLLCLFVCVLVFMGCWGLSEFLLVVCLWLFLVVVSPGFYSWAFVFIVLGVVGFACLVLVPLVLLVLCGSFW